MKTAYLILSMLAVAARCALADTTNESHSVSNAIHTEIQYADGLRSLGMPGYSSRVLSKISHTDNPEVGRAKFRDFVNRGPFSFNFSQLQPRHDAYIASLHSTNSFNYWVLKREQADAYFAWGKTNAAVQIYESLMEEVPQLMETKHAGIGQQTPAPYFK